MASPFGRFACGLWAALLVGRFAGGLLGQLDGGLRK